MGGAAERRRVGHGVPEVDGPLPALVVSVGFTGLTVKHSVALLSVDGGTPVAVPEQSARQQYRPAELTVAVGDVTVHSR